MVVRSEGDLCAIIPKVKISLTLSRYYYKASRNKIWDQIVSSFFLLPVTSHHPFLFLLLLFQISSLLKFLQHLISLAIKVCFLSFYTCSSCFVQKIRLMNMWYLRYQFLCMNSCLFMFNWYELREKWKHYPEFVKEKQTGEIEHTEHIFVLIFWGLIQLCLHFSIRLSYENSGFRITSFRWV